ncbi:MAG: nuclear transport factor 2 family protein [Actinobacteria bacterium]|nr:nuclear transport factor 2 family protein [Actinomycetota bacterium]
MREHIGRIFANWPDLAFSGRRLYVREGLVVSEWTARATAPDGRRLEWDGIDVFPCENGLILRKDVYSAGHRPRVLSP